MKPCWLCRETDNVLGAIRTCFVPHYIPTTYGLLRAHGRLEDARSLPQEMRNPVILPRDHLLVKLLLRHLHDKRGHCGYKSLIHEARRKYWIIGVRSMSKALTSKCITCRKLRKKPLDQLMGQIPSLRVAAGFPPFSNTAIDMFGPLHIKPGAIIGDGDRN